MALLVQEPKGAKGWTTQRFPAAALSASGSKGLLSPGQAESSRSGPLRCSGKVTPSPGGWQAQSIARTYSERKPDTVALALTAIARFPHQRPDQFQAETAHRLLSNEDSRIRGAKFSERIVRRGRVLVAQRKSLVAGIKCDPDRGLALFAIAVGDRVRE